MTYFPFSISLGDNPQFFIISSFPFISPFVHHKVYHMLCYPTYNKPCLSICILNRLHLVNKAWLNPENSDSKTMIALAKRMMKNQYRIINMMFHSSTLKPGLTPFIKTGEDGKRFIKNIREFLVFTRDNGIESIKISDALKII